MRRPLTLATLGLTLLLGAAGFQAPAGARADESERGGLTCSLAVVGVDGGNRLKEFYVENGKVTGSRSSTKLGVGLTGLGTYDAESEDGVKTTRLTATTVDGVPRLVKITTTTASKKLRVSSTRFAGKDFTPFLYVDAYGFYAYTINEAGVLTRWTLTRLRSGKLAYREGRVVRKNLKDAVALTTAAYRAKPTADILYVTTESGALKVVSVPYEAPALATFKTLAASGYEGVTELSSGYCNGKNRGVVAALDPVAGTATWTVVTDVTTPATAKAYPKGEITGTADWALHAVM